jgi:hypothetical protein
VNETDAAVLLHRGVQLGRQLLAIRALEVEKFDDRDVAVGIASDRDIRIAQHRGLVQHLLVAIGGHRRDRRDI